MYVFILQTRVEIIRNDGSGSDTSGSIDLDSENQGNNKLDSPTAKDHDTSTLHAKRGWVKYTH